MNWGQHAGFIIAAYSAAAMIVTAVTGWVVLDYRAQIRLLADLETRGVKRRSRRTAKKS